MVQKNPLPHSTPEAQGVASQNILDFVDDVDAKIRDLHSFMLLRHGTVVAEGWWKPYAPDIPHTMFSLSKSFTSTAVGLAIAEGRLSVDDTVASLLPDDAPATIGDNLAAMRVRHLLGMSTGHAQDTMSSLDITDDDNWARAILAMPVEFEPGTRFVYDTGASYLLSAIVQRLTGERLLDYLTPRLLEPLGIDGATWEQCPRGIDKGGFGLSITTEDIAKFGQLYLQRGHWQGRQVVPAEWVDDATALHTENGDHAAGNDWTQGYGYQFWRCQHDAYRGDGAFGQFCIVLPEQDAVLAITAGVSNMQAVVDTVWTHLLPALSPAAGGIPVSLEERITRLVIPYPAGSPTSPTAARVSGTRYEFAANVVGVSTIVSTVVSAVEFAFESGTTTLTLVDSAGEHRFDCGFGSWVTGRTTFMADQETAVAAAGAWSQENTFVVKLLSYETPFARTVTAVFSRDELELTVEQNVAFSPTILAQLVGKRADAEL